MRGSNVFERRENLLQNGVLHCVFIGSVNCQKSRWKVGFIWTKTLVLKRLKE